MKLRLPRLYHTAVTPAGLRPSHGPGVKAPVHPLTRQEETARGLWAVKVSFMALLATAVFEGVVVAFSGSAALLADTAHNVGNAATAIPLWVAFSLSRRGETRRYPYGYHRAEDLAGFLILLVIAASAAVAGYASAVRLLAGEAPHFVPLAMAAAAVGAMGNEAVAQFRIRVGRRIGSAALVADGYHARTDALTSLAVIGGLGGAALGLPILDPIVGLGISMVILHILVREAGPEVMSRFLDRINTDTLARLEQVASQAPGVRRVSDVRARWAGRRLLAEMAIGVDGRLTIEAGHQVAVEVQHTLLHDIPQLHRCIVHVEPAEALGPAIHPTAHHFQETGTRNEEPGTRNQGKS